MKRIVLLAMLSSGCVAAHPDSIKPLKVSASEYEADDCPALAAKDQAAADDLFRLGLEQKNTRTGDLIGVVAIGVSPTGLGAQNNTNEIARLKGERDAISTAKAAKACPEPPATVDEKAIRRQMSKERYAAQNP